MRTENVRRWVAVWADVVFWWVAFGCAVFLALGIVMPDWFARTSWSSGKRNSITTVFDSPAGYVGLVSLCGIVAFVVLAFGLWRRRWAVAAALVAAAAFAFGTYVAGNYWLRLSRGMVGLEGRSDSAMFPPTWTVHVAPAMPVFVFAALIGAAASIALAVMWFRTPRHLGLWIVPSST